MTKVKERQNQVEGCCDEDRQRLVSPHWATTCTFALQVARHILFLVFVYDRTAITEDNAATATTISRDDVEHFVSLAA